VGIVLGALVAATVLVIGVFRSGLAFPRFGRWLDARIYAAFPRAGHFFVNEREDEDEQHEPGTADRYNPFEADGDG
jgi:hypothetical protein